MAQMAPDAPGPYTNYLIDTVGETLSKGVAATYEAQPDDPVAYLARWLLKCVLPTAGFGLRPSIPCPDQQCPACVDAF